MLTSKYLITGGAGFIGGALTNRLIASGHRVSIIDLPEKIHGARIHPQAKVISGDIRTRDAFRGLDSAYDAVLHLAAQTSARISEEQPDLDRETNANGTLHVAEWCVERGISRILYASSMGVYGNPQRLPVSEKDAPTPVSNYGINKLAGEYFLTDRVSAGLQPTIFRMFNVYGPGQDMANLKQGMVSVYLAYIHAGKPVPVTGRLDRFRDFIYIDDVVDAWLATLHDSRSYGQIYNVGYGVSHTVRQVLDLLIKACGQDPKTYPVNEGEGHPGDTFGTVADISKMRADFNWTPRILLPEGIRRMVDWLRSAPRAQNV